jgi:ABC-type enterochelin transport system substrate-binding protein
MALLMAACGGGSDQLSAAGYARAASAICARANRAVSRVDLTEMHDRLRAARSLSRVVVIERRSLDELRDLRHPQRLAAVVPQWLALLDQATDELELMAQHLRHGNDAEAGEYAMKATTLLARARELVAPMRMTSCRGPELATV